MNMKSLCLSQCRMLALVISLIVGTAVFAQNVKRPESYNYMRGIGMRKLLFSSLSLRSRLPL